MSYQNPEINPYPSDRESDGDAGVNSYPVRSQASSKKTVFVVTTSLVAACFLFFGAPAPLTSGSSSTISPRFERLGKSKHHHKKKKHHHRNPFLDRWSPHIAQKRCDWVMARFDERDEGTPPDDLKSRYIAQAVDPNVFYRATAHIFWLDFAQSLEQYNITSQFLLYYDPDLIDDNPEDPVFTETKGVLVINGSDPELDNVQKLDGVPLTPKMMWTWTTGDQHLSNFGGR